MPLSDAPDRHQSSDTKLHLNGSRPQMAGYNPKKRSPRVAGRWSRSFPCIQIGETECVCVVAGTTHTPPAAPWRPVTSDRRLRNIRPGWICRRVSRPAGVGYLATSRACARSSKERAAFHPIPLYHADLYRRQQRLPARGYFPASQAGQLKARNVFHGISTTAFRWLFPTPLKYPSEHHFFAVLVFLSLYTPRTRNTILI